MTSRTLLLAIIAAMAFGAVASAATTYMDKTAEYSLQLGGMAACWADLNNDGWVDLCAGPVWRNDAGKGFTKISEDLGHVVAADFDNDGFTDLFSWTGLALYRNEGGEKFTRATMPDIATSSLGACWGDFNNDGFVDLYIGGYEDWDRGITYPSMVVMNEGGKSFRVSWTEAMYRTRGVTASDFDEDGDLDVYVSNYRLQPNVLRLNDGTGSFRDAAAEYNVVATSPGFDGGHSIGAAWGDFDSDGHIDLFAGNFAHVDDRGDQPKSRFLRNMGPDKGYKFDDLGTCGVYYQESYASPVSGDYDNDGNLDLYFTTVYGTASFGRPNNPVLFRNYRGFSFVDVTGDAGLAGQEPTYQAAFADYDNDGDLDLATAGKLFQNQGTDYHWLKVRLLGDGKTINRDAIGAQARVRLTSDVVTRQVEAGTGEGNQSDLTMHFGLRNISRPVQVEIRWPNGQTQMNSNVPTDQLLCVTYGK